MPLPALAAPRSKPACWQAAMICPQAPARFGACAAATDAPKMTTAQIAPIRNPYRCMLDTPRCAPPSHSAAAKSGKRRGQGGGRTTCYDVAISRARMSARAKIGAPSGGQSHERLDPSRDSLPDQDRCWRSARLPGGTAFAAMGPNDKFDLVVKGGEVLDPSQNLRARRDIGIRWGVIEAVEPDIPADRALRVLNVARQAGDAGPRRHACPRLSLRLRDRHPGRRADDFQGTTTMVSAGDAGANNFAAFRRFIVAETRTRLYAFVHIANIGLTSFPVPELYNIDYAVVDAAPRRSPRTPTSPRRQGAHVRERHRQATAPSRCKRSIEARAGRGGGARVMCHIGGVETVAADVGDSRPAAPRRHPHPCLFRPAEYRRRLHQHRSGRPAAAGGDRREAAWRHLRRRSRRRQLRLHGGRGGDRGGRDARHDLLRHPRGLRQHARACPISPG